MFKTLLGGLIGGVGMFLVSFIFWGTPLSALAYHRTEFGADLQAALARSLNASGTGVYVVPDPATAQGTVLFGKGPIATIFYNSQGFPVTDPSALISGLILALVVGVLIALMLRLVAGDFGTRARVAILFALSAVLWLHVGQAIFDHIPWGYTLYQLFSDFLSLAAAGLIAAKIMESRLANTPETVPADTVH